MALNFPNNPVLNQTASVNNRLYKWNGSAWQLVSYSLPIATTSSIGGVQIGAGLNVSSSGVVSNVGSMLYLWANFR